MGYLVTVSGLGGLAFPNRWLKWYAAHADWFLGTALLFLGVAAYFLLYRYPSRNNRLLMVVNVLTVMLLIAGFWT